MWNSSSFKLYWCSDPFLVSTSLISVRVNNCLIVNGRAAFSRRGDCLQKFSGAQGLVGGTQTHEGSCVASASGFMINLVSGASLQKARLKQVKEKETKH